jgi:hypothetical protein
MSGKQSDFDKMIDDVLSIVICHNLTGEQALALGRLIGIAKRTRRKEKDENLS